MIQRLYRSKLQSGCISFAERIGTTASFFVRIAVDRPDEFNARNSDKPAAYAQVGYKRVDKGRFRIGVMNDEDAVADRRDKDVTNEDVRSEEHTSELQSLMRISYAVFCLKKKNNYNN